VKTTFASRFFPGQKTRCPNNNTGIPRVVVTRLPPDSGPYVGIPHQLNVLPSNVPHANRKKITSESVDKSSETSAPGGRGFSRLDDYEKDFYNYYSLTSQRKSRRVCVYFVSPRRREKTLLKTVFVVAPERVLQHTCAARGTQTFQNKTTTKFIYVSLHGFCGHYVFRVVRSCLASGVGYGKPRKPAKR